MKGAIIGGTGFSEVPGHRLQERIVDTRYGRAHVFVGEGESRDLVFLPRHGLNHVLPPHRINYRANMMALKRLGVERALAVFTVGSLDADHPPGSFTALDQFIDLSHGRESTFFDGGEAGVVHTDVTEPLCPALRRLLLQAAAERGMRIIPTGTYICMSGPRFETAAEVRMLAQLGGHVVGMTAVPEIPLARELGIHYAAVAISVNWGAGLRGGVQIAQEGLGEVRSSLFSLFVSVLRTPTLGPCKCTDGAIVLHPERKPELTVWCIE